MNEMNDDYDSISSNRNNKLTTDAYKDDNIFYNQISNIDSAIKNIKIKNLQSYIYCELEDHDLYLLYYNLIIDKDKKIGYPFSLYLSTLNRFTYYYKSFSEIIKNNNLNHSSNINDIGENFIIIQEWSNLYGHFHDSLYNLKHFYNILKEKDKKYWNYKILISYNPTKNYDQLVKYIFDEQDIIINVNKKGKQIYKIKNLICIRSFINDLSFHLFPVVVRNSVISKILSKYDNSKQDKNMNLSNKTLVITRKDNYSNIKRVIDNLEEFENFFKSKSFEIINPEILSIDDLVYKLSLTKNIIMFYGSVMTNLIYANPHTNVYIIQSDSYFTEDFNTIWGKIISNYCLNINLYKTTNYIINPNQLDDIYSKIISSHS